MIRWYTESLAGEIGVDRRTPRGNAVRFYLPPKPTPDGVGQADGS